MGLSRTVGLNGASRIFPPFRPRPPWLTGDLQTIRNFVRQPVVDLSGFAGARLELPMRDGSGDRLVAEYNRPIGPRLRPLVVLIHGLTGCAESVYMRASALHLLRQGHPVLRLNLRGAGPTRTLCRERYHAGRSEDLHAAFAALPRALLGGGIAAVGYSLGGNMLLKYLAEQRQKGPVRAAASVSAPLDLQAASMRIMALRNRGYHDWLLRRMKEEALGSPALDGSERASIIGARHVREFDARVVAPRNGFAGADDYYERCSARRFVTGIAVPTLVIHALDDPWIPAAAYAGIRWSANSNLTVVLPSRGGHVGFHGIGTRTPWHDVCIGLFLSSLA